jgi:hypothetical protein
MTTTKQEQIVAVLYAALENTAGVSGRIYRSRTEAFSRDESPAVTVEHGPASASVPPVSTCYIDWTFQVVIGVYSRGQHGISGPSPDQAADPVIRQIHANLMADRSVGGLAMDLIPLSRDPQLQSAENPAMWTVLSYQVRFRTSITDLGA